MLTEKSPEPLVFELHPGDFNDFIILIRSAFYAARYKELCAKLILVQKNLSQK